MTFAARDIRATSVFGAVLALVVGSFVAVGPSAYAADSSVIDAASFSTAMGACTDGDTVTLDADVPDPSTGYLTACDLAIDLNGHALDVQYIAVGDGKTLTVQDTTPTAEGVLTADARAAAGLRPGIQTRYARLVVLSGTINAFGHSEASGIGVGYSGGAVPSGTIEIHGGVVNATGGWRGAGIGGGDISFGPTLTVTGGIVTATAGDSGVGIGSGAGGGDGGVVRIEGGTVTAIGGPTGIGVGGRSGGPGTWFVGQGASLTTSGGLGAIGRGSVPAGWADTFVVEGDLWLPEGNLEIVDGAASPEMRIGSTGRVLGTTADPTAGATISGAGTIVNNGVVALEAALVGVTLSGSAHDSFVTFVTPADVAAPAPVRLLAATFSLGYRDLLVLAPHGGEPFSGWNTVADGSGVWVGSETVVSGNVTLYAVYGYQPPVVTPTPTPTAAPAPAPVAAPARAPYLHRVTAVAPSSPQTPEPSATPRPSPAAEPEPSASAAPSAAPEPSQTPPVAEPDDGDSSGSHGGLAWWLVASSALVVIAGALFAWVRLRGRPLA